MNERTRRLSRRSFVLSLGAATAATVAAVATRSAPPGQPAAGKARAEKKGYQASAHVGRYYRTTRV
jgi:hypothetical protein